MTLAPENSIGSSEELGDVINDPWTAYGSDQSSTSPEAPVDFPVFYARDLARASRSAEIGDRKERVLTEAAAGVVISSLVSEGSPTFGNRSPDRNLWDRNIVVEQAKADLKFAKRGYSRKVRKEEVAQEAARQELKIKAEREVTGQIPIVEVKGNINKIKQNIAYRREMKRAVADAKYFAEHVVTKREQDASARLYESRQAYKDAKDERFRARYRSRDAWAKNHGLHKSQWGHPLKQRRVRASTN